MASLIWVVGFRLPRAVQAFMREWTKQLGQTGMSRLTLAKV